MIVTDALLDGQEQPLLMGTYPGLTPAMLNQMVDVLHELPPT